ncbi:hypothetical protein NL676_036689 [Syzygium grande]|nr:hypothetical protein NL676_036689 [Syzygium grande]
MEGFIYGGNSVDKRWGVARNLGGLPTAATWKSAAAGRAPRGTPDLHMLRRAFFFLLSCGTLSSSTVKPS